MGIIKHFKDWDDYFPDVAPPPPYRVTDTVYAVISTDTWGEDYCPVEVWEDREMAERRAAALSALTPELHHDGKPKYFHVVKELPFNREAPQDD